MTGNVHMKTCPDCNGDGVIEKGTDDEQQCPTCRGSVFVPDDWTMVDRAVVQTDRFSVVQGEGDNFVGTGTNLGNPTIITFKNGLLRWLTFNDNGIKTTETTYLCRR